MQKQADYVARVDQQREEAVGRLLQRVKDQLDGFQQGRSAEAPVLDVLVLSGGGEFGAFGAGVLKGWGAVTDPAAKRPEFDIVTGVSTGALIAPFAFLGDDESYERVARLYSEPGRDWINRRGLFFFLPGNLSLARIDGLKRDIKREFDDTFRQRIIAGSGEGRLLVIGTTNLDFGIQRMWELGREAIAHPDTSRNDRLVDIVLASSAVPGAFPPVEIDDLLYADGAITVNILYEDSIHTDRGMAGMWAMRYPGVPMPRVRYWVIINNQLRAPPRVTQPTWVSVTGAALSASVRSSTSIAMQHLESQLKLVNALGIGSMEMRIMSIPDDWRPPVAGRFEQQTMSSLVDLGVEMGANPSSWVTVVGPGSVPSTGAPAASADPGR